MLFKYNVCLQPWNNDTFLLWCEFALYSCHGLWIVNSQIAMPWVCSPWKCYLNRDIQLIKLRSIILQMFLDVDYKLDDKVRSFQVLPYKNIISVVFNDIYLFFFVCVLRPYIMLYSLSQSCDVYNQAQYLHKTAMYTIQEITLYDVRSQKAKVCYIDAIYQFE